MKTIHEYEKAGLAFPSVINRYIHRAILFVFLAVALGACIFPRSINGSQIDISRGDINIFLPFIAREDAPRSLNSIQSFRLTYRTQMTQTEKIEIPDSEIDSFMFIGYIEHEHFWAKSENRYDFNEYQINTTTAIEPFSGHSSVIRERYMVDDHIFSSAPYDPATADPASWGVIKRQVSVESIQPDFDKLWSDLTRLSLSTIISQSTVIGSEVVSDISTTHYRLTSSQALTDTIRMRMDYGGGEPMVPLEVIAGQIDIWLTVGSHELIQYELQAEGRQTTYAGSELLQPFVMREQYSITEINSNNIITVPNEVLSAVASQLEELQEE